MTTQQEHYGERERREGLGGRVRRFVDTELSRVRDNVRDKENRGARTRTDHPEDTNLAGREGVADRAYDSGPAHVDRAYDSGPAQETPAQETQRVNEPDEATVAKHDTGREPRLQPAQPEELRGQPGDQLAAAPPSPTHAAEGSAERVGLLNDVTVLRDEWQQVQGTFVDDPQRAVHEASALVDRTLDEIRVNVGSERPSETMSTEDLRVSFQRYREFFQRLLSA